MCLELQDVTLHTADEDITVYKVIGVDDISPYFVFQYKPQCTYKINCGEMVLWLHHREKYACRVGRVENAFHSFMHEAQAVRWLHKWNNSCSYYKVVKMTIPKGAKYYRGTFSCLKYDSIASDTIRAGSLAPL